MARRVEFCVLTKGRRFCWKGAESKIFKAALRKRHDLPNLTRLSTFRRTKDKHSAPHTLQDLFIRPQTLFLFKTDLIFVKKKISHRNFRGIGFYAKKNT